MALITAGASAGPAHSLLGGGRQEGSPSPSHPGAAPGRDDVSACELGRSLKVGEGAATGPAAGSA